MRHATCPHCGKYIDLQALARGNPQPSGFPDTAIPPTTKAVGDYMTELGIVGQLGAFMDHYEANGWKVGKNTMKNWKAACRNWKRQSGAFAQQNGVRGETRGLAQVTAAADRRRLQNQMEMDEFKKSTIAPAKFAAIMTDAVEGTNP